jgi:hypothetical protein
VVRGTGAALTTQAWLQHALMLPQVGHLAPQKHPSAVTESVESTHSWAVSFCITQAQALFIKSKLLGGIPILLLLLLVLLRVAGCSNWLLLIRVLLRSQGPVPWTSPPFSCSSRLLKSRTPMARRYIRTGRGHARTCSIVSCSQVRQPTNSPAMAKTSVYLQGKYSVSRGQDTALDRIVGAVVLSQQHLSVLVRQTCSKHTSAEVHKLGHELPPVGQ